jgi:hypothetical protein
VGKMICLKRKGFLRLIIHKPSIAVEHCSNSDNAEDLLWQACLSLQPLLRIMSTDIRD